MKIADKKRDKERMIVDIAPALEGTGGTPCKKAVHAALMEKDYLILKRASASVRRV